ncbi:MAG: sugar phosphate isomerase/epimerase family protein [Syntrophobacteraceae bacterium]
MRIGVFTVLLQDMPFKKALDRIVAAGISAVEIGTGGYPGNRHCPINELLVSEGKRKDYIHEVTSRGLIISALSCQYEPLSPDKALALESDEVFRKTVKLASLLQVPVVNVLSGLPAGASGDTCPNWVTCPFPPHNLKALDYQWNTVAIPYWKGAGKFAEENGIKIAVEMHPGMLVYNVESMLRLRDAVGPVLGCNLDPSHLFWNGVDLTAAIRRLGDAIFHVHGKDCIIDMQNVSVNGCNDNKPYDQIPRRAWTFRTIGYGHDEKTWKDIMSALSMVGYDYVISIEHEDAMMSIDEGLAKGVAMLKNVLIAEKPGKV